MLMNDSKTEVSARRRGREDIKRRIAQSAGVCAGTAAGAAAAAAAAATAKYATPVVSTKESLTQYLAQQHRSESPVVS